MTDDKKKTLNEELEEAEALCQWLRAGKPKL